MRPVMVHHWREAAFIHWSYPPAVVQRLLPPPLEVDTCRGRAWVGLVPFLLTVRPLILAAPEINLRTYVRGPDGGSGIYFFSLELGRPLAALAARLAYRIPYVWSDVRFNRTAEGIGYSSRRRRPFSPASALIQIKPGEPIEQPSPFDEFLTARFSLYAGRRRIWKAEVEHPAWQLYSARAIVTQGLTGAAGLPDPEGEPHALFSSGTRALFSAPRPLAGPLATRLEVHG
jgi:uncharacterized protein YqjF (DUF2071 family)